MTPTPTPVVTTPEEVQRRAGYQALQPVQRPPHWGVDLDPGRRPGVPMMRADPRPFPNARFPPEPQRGTPASPMHGRPNKQMPPVFGTALPLRGLAGAIRKLAYRRPDHAPSHWMLKMLGDRVESWTVRGERMLLFAVPITALFLIVRRARA